MKRFVIAVALAVPLTIAAQTGRPGVPATLAQLEWLAGAWAGEAGSATTEEVWTRAEGGAMLAVSRTIKGGRMVAFEYLRIVERDGGLVYIAQPGGRPPTEFVLTSVAEQSMTFENPAHDFPKAIRYTKRPDGTLEARVSDGGQKAETFVFRRKPR